MHLKFPAEKFLGLPFFSHSSPTLHCTRRQHHHVCHSDQRGWRCCCCRCHCSPCRRPCPCPRRCRRAARPCVHAKHRVQAARYDGPTAVAAHCMRAWLRGSTRWRVADWCMSSCLACVRTCRRHASVRRRSAHCAATGGAQSAHDIRRNGKQTQSAAGQMT